MQDNKETTQEAEVVEAKEITHSPLPQISQKDEQLDFFDALKEVQKGKKITRLMWPESEYGFLKDGLLHIYKDQKFYTWLVSDGDMEGKDWVVIAVANE